MGSEPKPTPVATGAVDQQNDKNNRLAVLAPSDREDWIEPFCQNTYVNQAGAAMLLEQQLRNMKDIEVLNAKLKEQNKNLRRTSWVSMGLTGLSGISGTIASVAWAPAHSIGVACLVLSGVLLVMAIIILAANREE